MTLAQEDHLSSILDAVRDQIDRKYRAGQAEHGGNLWERVPLVEDLIEEALDQITYALTLKSQQARVKTLLEEARNVATENPTSTQKLITRAMSLL
jgi:hypothetical protein|tara:strand:- start:242 stop:529 length:288 start_codon:yes stop_codon:yes gene_type:complete